VIVDAEAAEAGKPSKPDGAGRDSRPARARGELIECYQPVRRGSTKALTDQLCLTVYAIGA
jgi:hypothetical protein